MKSIKDQEVEARRLRAIRTLIPQHDDEGNDLWAALDFQIEMLTSDKDMSDALTTENDFLISCAYDVENWVMGSRDELAPSHIWRME